MDTADVVVPHPWLVYCLARAAVSEAVSGDAAAGSPPPADDGDETSATGGEPFAEAPVCGRAGNHL